MKRIVIVTTTVLLICAVLFGGCAKPAEEAPTPTVPEAKPTVPEVKTIEWTYTSFIPPFDCFAVDTAEWGERLEEATDGRLKINYYWAQSLVKMAGEFHAIASGTADVGSPSVTMHTERFRLGRVSGLLFVFKNQPQTGKVMISLLDKYKEFRDEYLPTRVLWYQTPPPADFASKDKPVKTMEDLKGMKVQTSAAEVAKGFELLGAVPVTIPMTETYHGLETGIIDAVAAPINGQYLWKLYEVTKYRTEHVWMQGRGFPTVMNIESYNKLPEDIKQIFDELTDPMQMTILVCNHHVDYSNESAAKILEYDKQVGNPPWYILPDAERERWKEVVWPVNEEYIEELEAKGLPGRAFVDDTIAFAKQFE